MTSFRSLPRKGAHRAGLNPILAACREDLLPDDTAFSFAMWLRGVEARAPGYVMPTDTPEQIAQARSVLTRLVRCAA